MLLSGCQGSSQHCDMQKAIGRMHAKFARSAWRPVPRVQHVPTVVVVHHRRLLVAAAVCTEAPSKPLAVAVSKAEQMCAGTVQGYGSALS